MVVNPRERYLVSGFAIAALGVVFFLSYLLYVAVHEAYLQGPVWLLPLGLLLVGVLSVALVYSGYWVAVSEFTPEQGWRVAIWLFAGLIAALALTFWPIFYQRIVGVAIEDPIFILLVSSGLGANAGVVAGISQVRSEQRFEHVEHARDSLQFLNRLLRHNVLNAITIIRGNAELLIEDEQPDAVAERARTIRDQSDQIDDLIQNTRILVQRVDGQAELEDVDLTNVVDNELETVRETYDEVDIDQNLADDVTVRADPLVSAVVENLLTNAICHNDKDVPKIEATLETHNDVAVLQIADNGPGLDAEDEADLTDPGQHGDHGLGLYLVDTLVSQYGGTLHFDENEPRGTVVTVELPLS